MVDHADRNLATEQLSDLNREFYSTDPSRYFRTRLDSLMMIAARSDLVVQGLRETLEVGTFKATSHDNEYASAEEIEHYVATEAVIILHHASEALLRLYFAHEHQPPCPWLEASRLRLPRDFKSRLVQLIERREDPGQVNRISLCFLGQPAEKARAQANEAAPGRTVADALQGALDLLVWTASRLTKDGNLYNAAKHGLAVVPAERGMSLGTDTPLKLSVHGQSLTYLERRPVAEGGPNTWNETTTWVKSDHYIAWTHLVLRLMGSIWSIGKLAYTGSPGELHPVFPDMVDEVMKQAGDSDRGSVDEATVIVETMSTQLAYYLDEETPRRPGMA